LHRLDNSRIATIVGSQVVCVARLQSSLYAKTQRICQPCSDKDVYFRAFTSLSHLEPASNTTTRANSQFPRPDFHRLDIRPYWAVSRWTQLLKEVSVLEKMNTAHWHLAINVVPW